jgi:hypothetical protein
MAVKCQHCGHTDERISVAAIDIDWLQQFVTNWYGVAFDSITSVSEFKKERACRYIFFGLAIRHCGVSRTFLSEKYMIGKVLLNTYIKYGHCNYSKELKHCYDDILAELKTKNLIAA